jgi:hypothetical protein
MEASANEPGSSTANGNMTTIEDLVATGAISRIEVDMAAREQPYRLLYGTPSFIAWLGELVNGAEPALRVGEATAAEQIDQLFHMFLIGAPLIHVRQFRYIRAEKNAVWELKTPDTRIFGWFMKKDCFVCVFGDWADRVKDHELYRGYRIAIRRLRRELGVDNTLYVEGVDPSDVLSIRHWKPGT